MDPTVIRNDRRKRKLPGRSSISIEPMKEISVIIPYFNSGDYIFETLESVVSQKIQNMEIIIVDDGSTDNVLDCVRQKFPDIHIVRTENRGPSHARNVGTKIATAAWIQYLDADDILGLDKLRRQLKIIRESKAGVVYGAWQELQELENGEFIKGNLHYPKLSGDTMLHLLESKNFTATGSMLLQRQSILEVGGYDEKMRCIEDVNFYLRLAMNGTRFERDEDPQPALLYRRYRKRLSQGNQNSMIYADGCFINAVLAENVWRNQKNELTEQQIKLLLEIYAQVARFYFERDRKKFKTVFSKIKLLDPQYLPPSPKALRYFSRWIGYEKAEEVALIFRRLKALSQNSSGDK